MSYTLLTHTPPTRAWHCTGSRDMFVASHAEWRVPRHFSMAARRERSATNGDGLSTRHPDSRPIVMLDLMFIERCRHWQLRNQTRGSQLGSTVFCDYTTMYTSRYTLITHTLRLTEPEATRAGARRPAGHIVARTELSNHATKAADCTFSLEECKTMIWLRTLRQSAVPWAPTR